MHNAEYQKAMDIYAQGLEYIPKAEGFRTGMKVAEALLKGASAAGATPYAASPAKEAARRRQHRRPLPAAHLPAGPKTAGA